MFQRLVCSTLLFTGALLALSSGDAGRAEDSQSPIPIESRLELMVDGKLIERLTGEARRVLHHPVLREVAINHDAPWEGSGSGYHTILRDGDLYRMYYRGAQFTIADGRLTQDHPEVICYAESRDGIRWNKPILGLFEFNGSRKNNIVWMGGKSAHAFAVFKDARPDIPADERYKALAEITDGGGLVPFASADGTRWRMLTRKPVIPNGGTDQSSLNVAFWDPLRGEYRAYYRETRDGYRDIRTATSKDFRSWSKGKWLDYPGSSGEHLYTSGIHPYYRAPHLLIGLPMRYKERHWPQSLRKALPEAEHRAQRAQADERYATALTDTLLMTSRDRRTFRRWNEAFIRPGPERPGTWNYGHLSAAWGIVETRAVSDGMPNELSIYATEGGWTGKDTQLRRYSLRIDGFASVHSGLPEGEMRTKPLTFKGRELLLNFATSAGGVIAVAIHDMDDQVIEGFGLDDCAPLFGDSLERAVTWKASSDVSRLAGRPVRLRFVIKDADLYSLRFR